MIYLAVIYLILLLLSSTSYAKNNYEPAIRTSIDAAFKQSGLEQDFINTKSALENKGQEFLRVNKLEKPAAVVGFGFNLLVRDRMRIKQKNLIFEMNKDRKELRWSFPF